MENLRGTLWGEVTFREVVNEGRVLDSCESISNGNASWFNQFMKNFHLITLKKPSPRHKDPRDTLSTRIIK